MFRSICIFGEVAVQTLDLTFSFLVEDVHVSKWIHLSKSIAASSDIYALFLQQIQSSEGYASIPLWVSSQQGSFDPLSLKQDKSSLLPKVAFWPVGNPTF